MSQFVHLHLHTQYSLLDGVNKIPDVLEKARDLGMPAIAMTDHGNMHGSLQFYEAAHKVGIKPILGCELYVSPTSRFDRRTKAQGGAINHLTVLAQNYEGYQNLCRLATRASTEGFYFKPRVDHELLKEHSKGLIVLSGCLASEVSQHALAEREEELKKTIEFYSSVFGENYYLEVQPHAIKEQEKLNQACSEFAKSIGVPLVATTDCHYLNSDDHFAQEVLMCIATAKNVTDPDRIRHVGVNLHLKTHDEMQAEMKRFSYGDEAIKNTISIADKCKVEFDLNKYYMPKYQVEENKTLQQMMEDNARAGLETRFLEKEVTEDQKPEYRERLEEELTLLGQMGFEGYFLVVADFILWAKNNDIPVGPGRGSAAGSLVAFCLGITECDPVTHKLLFERFLNPERVSLPDIDVDFCINGRDQVIKYVTEKYGADKVAQIATFGTLKAKAAIKDVGRALGIPYAETDKIAQLVPAPRQGFDFNLRESMSMEPKLKAYYEGEGNELISLALKLEGLTRHSSTHAAGVVIGDQPLIDLLPMMFDKDGNYVTQFSMKYVEKIGLVKFDFLGLKTLTVIKTAVDLIKKYRDIEINPNNLKLDDKLTYEQLCEGNTVGVFQLESSGITDITMRLKPSTFNDIVAILALYRPGPLDAGMVDHYIDRKHGKAPVVYLHPLMEEILKDTYGIIVYQEQIMKLAQVLAGYSLGDADLLRRAMGKKVPAEMAAQRERFLSGAVINKIDLKLAEEIFDQMETFARYGFNRSHSAAYGMITYQTAYLRAHYPVEFMAALMTNELDDTDKVLKNLTECRNIGIHVLPPDINKSVKEFSVEEKAIRYGLAAIKGIGEKAVEAIIEGRGETPFTEFEEFLERVDAKALNKRVVENLIKSGGCDCLNISRRELLERIEDAMKAADSYHNRKDSNQMSLFATEVLYQVPRKKSNLAEFPSNIKLSMEREALGFYISGHPLFKYKENLKRLNCLTVHELKNGESRENVRIGGVVTALKLKNTKKGDRYASLSFEDWTGAIESLVWPRTYREVATLLETNDPLLATCRLDATEERSTLIIEKLESLIDLRDRSAKLGVLKLVNDDAQERNLKALLDICKLHAGNCPVRVNLKIEGEDVFVSLRDEREVPVCVYPSEDLCNKVEQIFGRSVLSFI